MALRDAPGVSHALVPYPAASSCRKLRRDRLIFINISPRFGSFWHYELIGLGYDFDQFN
jgi:hypothetical protein